MYNLTNRNLLKIWEKQERTVEQNDETVQFTRYRTWAVIATSCKHGMLSEEVVRCCTARAPPTSLPPVIDHDQ